MVDISSLSKRAQKTYKKLLEGKFYKVYDDHTPLVMQELIDAGLVDMSGRIETIVLCYVPKKGFKPLKQESWDHE
jgi:hypothetical protein